MTTPATAATGGQALVLRRRRRHAVESLVLQTVLIVLVVLGGGVILGSGPVDYRAYGWLATSVAGPALVPLVLLFLLRFALTNRLAVVLTPEGIGNGQAGAGGIAWSQIVTLRTVWRPTGRHVRLTRRHGRAVTLAAPRGSGWLPDPAFRREIAELRQWTARHGPEIEQGDQGPRRPVVATLLAVLVVCATAAVRAADRGVIWPSMPTASHATAACPALQAAGLDRFWPADTRILERDDQDMLDLGEYSYCSWVWRPGHAEDAPYIRISAVVKRHTGYAVYSPTAMAVSSYQADHAAEPSPTPLPGLGDEAFRSSATDDVLVAARLANVTVNIDLDLVLRNQREAEETARDLTAHILAGVRLDEPARPR